MTDPTAIITEQRNLIGQMERVELIDAAGRPCGVVEYDVETGRPSWVNLRDDLAAARPDLAALRDELLAAR
jgi:hypothetical protein